MLKFDIDTHTYKYGTKRLPSVSEILNHSLGKFCFGNEVTKALGTELHLITKFYDSGKSFPCPSNQKKRLEGYIKFLNAYKPTFITIEEPIMDLDNKYAGTPDRVAVINDKCVIYDIKRSNSPSKRYCYQTAAYKRLVEKAYSIKVNERWCVFIQDNKFKVEPHTDKMDEVLFHQMLINYNNKD